MWAQPVTSPKGASLQLMTLDKPSGGGLGHALRERSVACLGAAEAGSLTGLAFAAERGDRGDSSSAREAAAVGLIDALGEQVAMPITATAARERGWRCKHAVVRPSVCIAG